MDSININNVSSWTESGAASTGSSLSTGDLRRRYNFGSKVSSLMPRQDPFFRMLSMFRKEATDDPQFKFTEERESWHKRYAYVIAHGQTAGASTDATLHADSQTKGKTYYFRMEGDYKTAGNITNVYGQSNSEITVGASGTRPRFFIVGQVIKVNTTTAVGQAPTDYILARIEEITESTNYVDLKTVIVKGNAAANDELSSFYNDTTSMTGKSVYGTAIANSKTDLESMRSYVVGSAFAPGSGYPDTWQDQPYSTGYGMTQIFKTALGMDNTTRATVLKYASSEWLRLWQKKLIEHKWDIETALLFGSQTSHDGIQYTQGLVDYALDYGQLYDLTLSTKTCDDFLDDMSQYVDVRTGIDPATLFMCDKPTYNWLNKLSGYAQNNVQLSPNNRMDFSFEKRGSLASVPVNVISTIYGSMNIAHNPHLDGTPIKILAANMNKLKLRPLVGNGLNRDTAVYVGVQTLENTGIDKRVDLILTELGLEATMPECHAVWK